MAHANPKWDFLKDLSGDKPSWRPQKDKHTDPLSGQSLMAWPVERSCI